MQKVLTITTHTNIIEQGTKFHEAEYPILNKYLEEGYKIAQIVPVTLNSTTAYMYSITFLLEK